MSAIIKKENLIGINEAAEFLEVKPATIRDLIRKGKDILRRKIGKVCINVNLKMYKNGNLKMYNFTHSIHLSIGRSHP